MRVDDIHEIADAPWRMAGSVEMDVDAAGLIRKSPSFSQPSRESLYHVNILPIQQDWADQFHAVVTSGGYCPSPILFLAVNAAVIHQFPSAPIGCGDFLGIVIIPGNRSGAAEIMRDSFCCFFPADSSKLDLQTELFGKHLPSFLAACEAWEGRP